MERVLFEKIGGKMKRGNDIGRGKELRRKVICNDKFFFVLGLFFVLILLNVGNVIALSDGDLNGERIGIWEYIKGLFGEGNGITGNIVLMGAILRLFLTRMLS